MKEQVFALNIMSKKSVALYHKYALSIGISDSALGVLYALSISTEPCSQFDLCNEWSIPKQTINTTVTSLLNKGFVSLAPIPGTRNKKNIALTDSGKEFTQKYIGALIEAERDAFIKLTSEEREQYIGLNKKYNESLAEKLDSILGDNLN